MRLLRLAATVTILFIVLIPLTTNAAIKYGPDAQYRRGASTQPCFFSRQAIEYAQGAGGVVHTYLSHFWVYVSSPTTSLHYKHSWGKYNNDDKTKMWIGPYDYPLPLTSQNTPRWVYESYSFAGHPWGGVWPWNPGNPGYVSWRDRAGDDPFWLTGWNTNLLSTWEWSHFPVGGSAC